MMKSLFWRMRYLGLTLAAGSLGAFSGCGLSDQQLSSIWYSVLSTGLNTVVGQILSGAFEATGGTA
ncbi:MAG: hypothetical protein KAY37_00495 [Phycisphaerae bacterium]|nr:hypothetical protein [Phycisphaerae bacterium]